MTESLANLSLLAGSGDHRRGEERAPSRYKEKVEAEFRARILETLGRLEWAYIGTVSSDGWPLTSASRFIFVENAEQRPTLYMIAKAGSVAAAHIADNPRVGVETHLAVGWLERRKARALQFQALASFVEGEEAARIGAAFRLRFADAADFGVDADDHVIRIEPLSVVNFYATGRPQWGYVDYTSPA